MKNKKQELVDTIRKLRSESKVLNKLHEIEKIVFSQTGDNSEKVRLMREVFNKAEEDPDPDNEKLPDTLDQLEKILHKEFEAYMKLKRRGLD